MNEQWIRWEPIRGLSAKYYIDSISHTMKGLKILLSDAQNEQKKMMMIFEDSVEAFRSTDESFRRSTLYYLEQQYGTKFYAEWTFFKIPNSTYIQWLSEQSYGISDPLPLIHFSFLAMDLALDVIAVDEPRIELIDTSIDEKQ